MDKPPAAFGDLQLVHAADNRSGQLMWYIKRSVLFVIDNATAVAMVFKLIRAAAQGWPTLKGSNQLPKLIGGVKFSDGIEVTETNQNAAA